MGGVYKVWVTPVEDYVGDPDYVPTDKKDAVNGEDYQPGNYHGFIPAASKTDNFKVKKKGKPCDPPEITVRKYHDRNFNGNWDDGEEEITGWAVYWTDPLGVEGTEYTPALVVAEPSGDWVLEEDTPPGTMQTAAMLDGVPLDVAPLVTVPVDGECGETHEVIYGNVGLGQITACKIYDRDGNGVANPPNEPGVSGWWMQLDGMLDDGSVFGPVVQVTDAEGCTTFSSLLPGAYTVSELLPGEPWVSTSVTFYSVDIESSLDGSTLGGTSETVIFTNYCEGYADFGTKGYWHNKNGLSLLTEDDRDYVNSLLPYSAPSTYFGAGDEPFDGVFEDGTPVEEAFSDDGSSIWGAGTWQAEISHFLVDANASGDPREQLAQQLLAFIFNTRYHLDDPAAYIWNEVDGVWVSASDLIDQAIAAWESGTAADQDAIKDLLDAYNNDDALLYIHYYPCDVEYPAME
jgi:hypothetical protein